MSDAPMKLSLRQKLRIKTIAFAGRWLLRILHATLRWRYIGFEGRMSDWVNGPPIIAAFWHGRQLMMPFLFLRYRRKNCSKRLYTLISEHRDGRIAAETVRRLGIESVAGSSTHHGRRALQQLVEILEDGNHAAITPDGPRGPACRSKPGVLSLAMRTGAPIVPAAYSAEKVWRFSSWDAMILPKPFSRAVYVVGQPLSVPEELSRADFDRYLREVEDAINRVTQRADAECGRSPAAEVACISRRNYADQAD